MDLPRDPHFALKASRVLDLSQWEWEGQLLGGDEYVLSADEKPGIQARMCIRLPLPPGPRRAMRAESEYHRYGTLAYLAAYDVHRARVIGRCEEFTGAMLGDGKAVTMTTTLMPGAFLSLEITPSGDVREVQRRMGPSRRMPGTAEGCQAASRPLEVLP